MIYQYKSAQGPIRDTNEDEIDIEFNYTGSDKNMKPYNYFAVYDGHGGASISKYVKDRLGKYFMEKKRDYEIKRKSANQYIYNIYDIMQNKIEESTMRARGCGTTALVVIQHEKNGIYNLLKVINLGDCRAVLCNYDNRAISLTKDHKPMAYDEFNRITKLGGIITHDRGDDPRINNLSVSRAFGDLDAKPHVSHVPEIFDYELNVKRNEIIDKFLILACDGVWDVLSCQDAVDFVLFRMSEIRSLDIRNGKGTNNIAQMLGKHAIAKGSEDNISIIIIFF
jgi:protein phosphatase 2C